MTLRRTLFIQDIDQRFGKEPLSDAQVVGICSAAGLATLLFFDFFFHNRFSFPTDQKGPQKSLQSSSIIYPPSKYSNHFDHSYYTSSANTTDPFSSFFALILAPVIFFLTKNDNQNRRQDQYYTYFNPEDFFSKINIEELPGNLKLVPHYTEASRAQAFIDAKWESLDTEHKLKRLKPNLTAKDPFVRLGIQRPAGTPEEQTGMIDRHVRHLALQIHPDKNNSSAESGTAFKLIENAREAAKKELNLE